MENLGQLEAIAHDKGPALVLAGPGSGKTYVITHRLYHLTAELGVPPEKILVITFTKAAACEMQDRANKLDYHLAHVKFGTFHSVFYQILNKSLRNSQYKLVTDKDRFTFLREEIKQWEKKDPTASRRDVDIASQVEEMVKAISQWKNSFDKSAITLKEKEKHIMAEYEKWLNDNHMLDFDDMLIKCYELLQNPTYLRFWEEFFQYILIDEFQDINPLQYEIIKLLCKSRNIFCVGDDDQAIYSFRGSSPKLMQVFKEDYDAKLIELSYNYRCSKRITDVSAQFVANNKDRFTKTINAVKEAGDQIQVVSLRSREEQFAFLKKEIFTFMKEHPDKDQAILCRTNKLMASFATLLQAQDQMHDLWPDVKAFLSFLHLGRKREDFIKIRNKPMRYLSRDLFWEETVDLWKVLQRADKPWIKKRIYELASQCEIAKHLDLYGVLKMYWDAFNYGVYVRERYPKETDYVEAKEFYEQLMEWSRQHRDVAAFIEEVEGYFKDTEDKDESDTNGNDGKMESEKAKNVISCGAGGKFVMKPCDANGPQEKKKKKLHLMTFHGSKGLEFDRVYLPDLNFGRVPHGRMLEREELEEERRMMYVAMTRAKESLYLLHITDQAKSPFLPEIVAGDEAYNNSSNSQESKYSSKASSTFSYSSSSSM